MYVCMFVYMYVCMFVCMYVCIFVCICVQCLSEIGHGLVTESSIITLIFRKRVDDFKTMMIKILLFLIFTLNYCN